MKNLILFSILITSSFCLKLKWEIDEKGPDSSGSNIGTNLYTMQVVTSPMKRPQKHFVNVMIPKKNDRIFREAQDAGLHYQLRRLQQSRQREYEDNIKSLYESKLATQEQKYILANLLKGVSGV